MRVEGLGLRVRGRGLRQRANGLGCMVWGQAPLARAFFLRGRHSPAWGRCLLLPAGYLTSLPRTEEHHVVAAEQGKPGLGVRVWGSGLRVNGLRFGGLGFGV